MPNQYNKEARHSQRILQDILGRNDSNNEFASDQIAGNADGSILERIEYLQDILAGTAGIAAFPTAAAAANAVSLAEVLRYMSEYQLPRIATKQFATVGSQLTTGLSPVTIFTILGKIKAKIWGFIDTAITSTGGTGTLAVGVTGNTAAFIAATTADGTNFPTGSVWAGDTSPTVKAEVFSATALNGAPVNNTNAIMTIATNSMTAGDMTMVAEWLPMNSSASLS